MDPVSVWDDPTWIPRDVWDDPTQILGMFGTIPSPLRKDSTGLSSAVLPALHPGFFPTGNLPSHSRVSPIPGHSRSWNVGIHPQPAALPVGSCCHPPVIPKPPKFRETGAGGDENSQQFPGIWEELGSPGWAAGCPQCHTRLPPLLCHLPCAHGKAPKSSELDLP